LEMLHYTLASHLALLPSTSVVEHSSFSIIKQKKNTSSENHQEFLI